MVYITVRVDGRAECRIASGLLRRSAILEVAP
jgi:hypothetical protein